MSKRDPTTTGAGVTALTAYLFTREEFVKASELHSDLHSQFFQLKPRLEKASQKRNLLETAMQSLYQCLQVEEHAELARVHMAELKADDLKPNAEECK